MLPTLTHHSISIPLDSITLPGELNVVAKAPALVIFTHGSGSSRLSPRNRLVADRLEQAGFSTLLFDLLTERENELIENRFNISLLTERLLAVTQWTKTQPELQQLRLGYFGASTGAAAVLEAAVRLPNDTIKAIVSRGGRPDLVDPLQLARVQVPSLFIVGGNDEAVIKLNQLALAYIPAAKKLKIVPGASHLFEEPGTMERVAALATKWFQRYLTI